MNREKLVVIAVASLVAYTFALGVVNLAISAVQTESRISSGGAVKAIGVMVYSDEGCTSRLTSVDWGLLEPGESEDVPCYIRNEGNSAVTLSLSTENWNPSEASLYITLSWNCEGRFVDPDEVVAVTLTLTVSDSVSDITDFSFDIVIVGSG